LRPERVRRLAHRSVDARQRCRDAFVGIDGLAERRERDDRMERAVQRRTNELGHARIEDHDARLALADVKHAADEPATSRDYGSSRLDCQTCWTSGLGQRVDLCACLVREPVRGGDGRRVSVVGDGEAATRIKRIELRQLGALELQQSKADAERRPPRVDRAEL
jgi:hypothetical protein